MTDEDRRRSGRTPRRCRGRKARAQAAGPSSDPPGGSAVSRTAAMRAATQLPTSASGVRRAGHDAFAPSTAVQPRSTTASSPARPRRRAISRTPTFFPANPRLEGVDEQDRRPGHVDRTCPGRSRHRAARAQRRSARPRNCYDNPRDTRRSPNSAVQLRLGEKRGRGLEDVVRPAQFSVLPPKFTQLVHHVGRTRPRRHR